MEPLDRLLTILRRANEASQTAKDRSMVHSGLTKAQYNALLMLRRDEGHTVSQLAAACGVSQQAMSQTVARLVKGGFMASSPSPHGGRALVLNATERGDTCLDLADTRVVELEHALRAAIEQSLLEPLIENLAALQRAADGFAPSHETH